MPKLGIMHKNGGRYRARTDDLPSFVNYLEKFRRNKVKKETIIIKTMIF